MSKRGYYRVPTKWPANRVEGALADAVRAYFAQGWPKAKIAREFRLNRRTVARLCAKSGEEVYKPQPVPCTFSLSAPSQR